MSHNDPIHRISARVNASRLEYIERETLAAYHSGYRGALDFYWALLMEGHEGHVVLFSARRPQVDDAFSFEEVREVVGWYPDGAVRYLIDEVRAWEAPG